MQSAVPPWRKFQCCMKVNGEIEHKNDYVVLSVKTDVEGAEIFIVFDFFQRGRGGV